jgi:hypothetical protein
MVMRLMTDIRQLMIGAASPLEHRRLWEGRRVKALDPEVPDSTCALQAAVRRNSLSVGRRAVRAT